MTVSTIPAHEVEHLVAAGAETGEGPLWGTTSPARVVGDT